jgi:hypothetical protein
MKKIFSFLIYLLSSVSIYSQTEFVDTSIISRIKDEAYNNSRVMNNAFYITDYSGPRLTWSSGYNRAAEWTLNEFKKWGLQNVHKEEWEPVGKNWEIVRSYVAIKTPYYQNIAATPKAWSGSTNGLVIADVMLVSAKDRTDFIKKYAGKLKGKILIFENKFPPFGISFKQNANRFTADSLAKLEADTTPGGETLFESDTAVMSKKFQSLLEMFATYFMSDKMWTFCKKEGAVAILSMGGGREGTYAADGSYNYAPQPNLLPIANVNIRPEDYLRIIRLIEHKIPVKMELDIKTSIKPQPIKGYNLVAEISGTDPVLKNELVIIGGHFDSWHAATGATDNGAGSVVMMEVMRILKTMKLNMKRTVRIVLWGGEEQGLLGSLAYVNKNVAEFSAMRPLRDYDRISAYYNLDNGSGRIRGIHLQNNEALRSIFKQWLEPFKDLEATTVSIKNSGYTDNESFDLVGIPAFQFIQDELNYETRAHHTNADTYDQLSEDDMKQASTIIASLVYNTANRKEKLPRKPTPKPYGNFNFYLLQ